MRKKEKILKGAALVIAVLASLTLIVAAVLYLYTKANIDPSRDEMLFDSARKWNSTVFYALPEKDGDEPAAVEYGGAIRKIFCPLQDISPLIKEGFISVEDRDFYSHKGVDLKRTLLAAINYITRREKIFGASTITQQVIKNLSGDNELKLSRKLSEIIRASYVEARYTKEDILEVYLNVIPMSENLYGVAAASRAYFKKEPSELTPAEAATLIGITNAPTAYNPHINPDACLQKRNTVLGVMRECGVISKEEYDKAVNSPLGVIPREEREDVIESWFIETVISDATADLSEKLGLSEVAARLTLLGGGFTVYTTMNKAAQSILEKYFEDPEHFPTAIRQGLEYSAVVIDPQSGDLSAIIGSVKEKRSNRLSNHALLPHPPASALKPLALYAPLIDSGRANWATVFDDVPIDFTESTDGLSPYPHNSPDVYSGLITLKDAIRLSKNTVAVRVCNLLGTENVYRGLKSRYGFSGLIDGGGVTDLALAPMALGQLSYGIPLTELTAAYNVFASEGIKRNMRSYLKITDHNGLTVIEKGKTEEQVYKRTTAQIMNQLLSEVVKEGTAKAITLKSAVPVAGKTGTSSGGRDKLFVGYTPYFTAGIWCGYPDSGKSASGYNPSHLEIWDGFMTELHSALVGDSPPRRFATEGLVIRPYCMDSGMLYSESCRFDPRGSRLEYGYFTPDNQPEGLCHTHVLVNYDGTEKGIATDACPKDEIAKVALIAVIRQFPTEVYVNDAEFVWRGNYYSEITDEVSDLPYFYRFLPDGVYAGITRRKQHFNRLCPIHTSE